MLLQVNIWKKVYLMFFSFIFRSKVIADTSEKDQIKNFAQN